jgi:hypothetical protein
VLPLHNLRACIAAYNTTNQDGINNTSDVVSRGADAGGGRHGLYIVSRLTYTFQPASIPCCNTTAVLQRAVRLPKAESCSLACPQQHITCVEMHGTCSSSSDATSRGCVEIGIHQVACRCRLLRAVVVMTIILQAIRHMWHVLCG